MLMLHNPECENNNKTTIRNSPEAQIYWEKHFHKNATHFRKYAYFQAENEISNSSKGKKTTNIYEQNPILIGYYISSKMEDVLKSGYYKSPLGYDNVDWFVNEVKKIENKMAFHFKNTKKDIIMTEEDEEDLKNNNNFRYCAKIIESDKVRDHCHLTGKYKRPAHSECNINVSQDKIKLFHIYFTILVIMIVKCSSRD